MSDELELAAYRLRKKAKELRVGAQAFTDSHAYASADEKRAQAEILDFVADGLDLYKS